MTNQPNEPVQNYEIVNPTLEQQVRTLLPSVAGYGGLLRSTNTVIPVVDVTTAAEGSTLPESLQFAIAFGSQTTFDLADSSTNIISSPGFYRLIGGASLETDGSDAGSCQINMTDGISTKTVYKWSLPTSSSGGTGVVNLDLVFFVASGVTVTAVAGGPRARFSGSTRQIATADGTLVDPAGYPI